MFDLMPYGRTNHLWNYMNDLERSFFQNSFSGAQFSTDIVDTGNSYELRAELPGFNREDISLKVDNGRLTIQAQRNEDVEEKKENYLRRERRFGSYTRTFDVSDIHVDDITAKYENGVLTLNLPKQQSKPLPPPMQIEIQ